MSTAFVGIVIIGIVGWFWQDSLRAKESACAACRKLCHAYDYQFLDDTIALKRVRLRRNSSGRATLARSYSFDFSLDGADRYRGSVETLGAAVQAVHLPTVTPMPNPNKLH